MIDALLAKAESLCRAVAPRDLGDTPLYIVRQSLLAADQGGTSLCDGFTTGCLDLYCRLAIGDAWRGRGACMVLNDTDLAGLDAVDVEVFFLATAIHELAHILERPALYMDRPEAKPDELRREAASIGKLVAADSPPVEKVVPFLGHGARFIRAALHLCHRARALDAPIAASRVCAGAGHGLSHAHRYLQALGDEPKWLADARMLDILGGRQPDAFSRVWTDDVVYWFSICPLYGERLFS